MMYNDFEGDGDGAAEAYSTGINSGDGRGVLRRKNGYGGNGESSTSAGSDGGRNAKTSDISSDLERTYGVKPTPAVARAVNQLDTWAQLTGRCVSSLVLTCFVVIVTPIVAVGISVFIP